MLFVPIRVSLQVWFFWEEEQFVPAAHHFPGSPCFASLWFQGCLLRRWGSGQLEQPAEIKQADNAFKDVFCLSFPPVFPNTEHLPRSMSEEFMFLLNNKTQQGLGELRVDLPVKDMGLFFHDSIQYKVVWKPCLKDLKLGPIWSSGLWWWSLWWRDQMKFLRHES